MNDPRGLRNTSAAFLVISLLFAVRCVAEEPTPPVLVRTTRVPIEQDWTGEVPIALKQHAPKSRYVADSATWKKLWRTFRGKEQEVPDIDFDKSLVLVAVGRDPNLISIQAARGPQGDISTTIGTTFRLYHESETCRYHFALIQREGIKTIDGKTIVGGRSPNLGGVKEYWDRVASRLVRETRAKQNPPLR